MRMGCSVRRMAVIVGLLLALGATGCGSGSSEGATSQSTASTSTTSAAIDPANLLVCSKTETYLAAGGTEIVEAGQELLDAAVQAPNQDLREAATWLARHDGFDPKQYEERTGPQGQQRIRVIQQICEEAGRTVVSRY
jgi:hypothetical protein